MGDKAIFVVEGDPDVRSALGEALGDLGARPVLFANVEELLAALETDTPSLLVLDLRLPGPIPATDLLFALRRTPRWSQLPTVVFTAWRDTNVPDLLNIPVIAKPHARELLAFCQAAIDAPPAQTPQAAGSSASDRIRRTGTAP